MQICFSQEQLRAGSDCRARSFARDFTGTCQASTVPLRRIGLRWAFCYLVVFGSITSRKRRDRMAANER